MLSLGCLIAVLALSQAASGSERPCVVVVVGAPGAPEYASVFREWAGKWRAAAEKGAAQVVLIGLDSGEPADRDRLQKTLAEQAAVEREPLWLVLIGHGTFDNRQAKFNLRGPDVTDQELAGWLAPLKRPVAVVDCSSSSGPFLNRLSAPNRVVVTATRSGNEQNYARFGEYLAGALTDAEADLDKDGQVSLLEAFLIANSRVQEFYKTKSRLATEHALIDDNGDKLGTPAEWFRGVRATQRAKDGAPVDGLRANQLHLIPSDRERALAPEIRERRNQLEIEVAALRDQKSSMKDDEYYTRLEALMLELARLYEAPPATAPARGR